jgi:predicted DNA-binding transcriptional regulator AlpA
MSAMDDLRLFRRTDLCDTKGRQGLLGVSEATFDRWVAAGTFPQPIRIGPRLVRWPARVVREWIRQQQAIE